MTTAPESTPTEAPMVASIQSIGARRFAFFTAVLFLTVLGVFLWADFLWRTELYGLKWGLLIVFVPLFLLLSFGFCQSVFGFFLRRGKGARNGVITAAAGPLDDVPLAPTALLFPVYNEDPARVFAGIRATIEALRGAGALDAFEFFVLSDTRDPETWIKEERAWLNTCRQLDVTGRLHYRRRIDNTEKKAGNISDFVRRWGQRSKYMICFDADSLMTADTLVRLVKLMERFPKVGIIQTAPSLCRGHSPFARMLQFANRCYGGIFTAGLNFWQQRTGNYWGHNAIIRIQPFAEACALPDLPWREPIGGKILSHDFVEAALMRRAGLEVWLAEDLTGSYEEGPPHLVAFAQRDRRWCQGNLQHGWLALARGISPISRIHFINGIFAYLGAACWFLFLLLSTLVVVQFQNSGLSLIAANSGTPLLRLSLNAHGLVLLGLTAILLYLPKILAVLDQGLRRQLDQYGGFLRALPGMLVETLVSALMAPVLMLYHTQFVLSIFLGIKVGWNAQDRSGDEGLPLFAMIRHHGVRVLIGLGWGIIAWQASPVFFAWMSPVLLGMVLAPFLTSVLASPALGRSLEGAKFWQVPEETTAPEIFRAVDRHEAELTAMLHEGHADGVLGAILDPYINALHVTLQEQAKASEAIDEASAEAKELVSEGFAALPKDKLLRLLADPQAMQELHHRLWHAGADHGRHASWEPLLNRFATRFA
jgi:membrane glycosyltransferase